MGSNPIGGKNLNNMEKESSMNYVIAIKPNGERLIFERWVYEDYVRNQIKDVDLLSLFYQCIKFVLCYW